MVSQLKNQAGKYLKPYQGLKQPPPFREQTVWQAGKYLKPYQGLKLITVSPKITRALPENT